jgi:hypothetical protein
MSSFRGVNAILRIWKAFPKTNFHKFGGTSVKNSRNFREKPSKIEIPETSEH